jgi:SNF2 family DNA or RNA helicase
MRPPLFKHQREDIELIKTKPYFMNASEQGSGKTRTAIEAAQQLFEAGEIDQMLIVAPPALRTDVWYSEDLGQLKQYLTCPARVTEYQAKTRSWEINLPADRFFHVIVTNYEFIRQNTRLEPLLKLVDARRTFLVLDESSAVSNHEARQTKACAYLRAKSKRVLLMNGTPVDESPGHAYAQFRLLHPDILGAKNWWNFRARYGVLGGFQGKQIIRWTNLDDLSRRTTPYVVRHMKKDCLDLPPKLPSVFMSVPLSSEIWRIYKEMRDDTLAWLDQNSMATAAQAGVRVMRLAQITSGFLGGIKDVETEEDIPTRDIGREKLDLLLDFVEKRLHEDKDFKLLVWSRFRPEVERTSNELKTRFPGVPVGVIWGGQDRDERSASITLLDPRHATPGPALVVGTVATGAMGLNLAAAHDVVYLSNDWSARIRSQSEERVHRPGQTFPVSYFEILATGPNGQKTVDHAILQAMKRKQEDAVLTMAFWSSTLRDETPE